MAFRKLYKDMFRDFGTAVRGAANYTASEAAQAYRGFMAAPPAAQDAILSSVGYGLPSRGLGIPLRRAVGGARYWVRRSAYTPRWQSYHASRRNGTYTGPEARYRRYGATLVFNGPGALTKQSVRRIQMMDRTTRQAQRRGLTTAFRGTRIRSASRRTFRKSSVSDQSPLVNVLLKVHK